MEAGASPSYTSYFRTGAGRLCMKKVKKEVGICVSHIVYCQKVFVVYCQKVFVRS